MARLVAPVSRLLATADVARSVAFYRDVLGFDVVTPTPPAAGEVVSGPARLQFLAESAALDSTGRPRPRGAALLFFETDDVAALHVAIAARGASASDLQKVNWIKMELFQIHDPDGHTLWFGQSFRQPEGGRDPARQLRRFLPALPLSDVAAGIAYYRRTLGFRINYAQNDLGVMDRDDVTLLLIARTERHTGIGACEAYVRDADALYAELSSRGADIQGPPVSRPWGLREFRVRDPEGNEITFAQPFE
jgi:catechol 2,3-dioxygenase-like lactoylglutathione lyase family enzyme